MVWSFQKGVFVFAGCVNFAFGVFCDCFLLQGFRHKSLDAVLVRIRYFYGLGRTRRFEKQKTFAASVIGYFEYSAFRVFVQPTIRQLYRILVLPFPAIFRRSASGQKLAR